MAVDPEIRHQALSCLLLGFVGETPPTWLLDAFDLGLAGVVLFGSNLADGTQVNRLTQRFTSAAGRPLVLATDEEGGDVTRLDTLRGSAVPGAAALGYLDDVEVTEETYAAIGVRLAEAGLTMNLAPVADVNIDPLNPVIGLRSFGADPVLAGRHVAAAVRGVQRAGVAACVKHFPGHGATRDDSHHEVAVLDRSREEIESVELEPFRAGIAAGARAVMTGHLLAPALDPDRLVTLSRDVTEVLLRERLGFSGVIVTDALEMQAVASTVGIVEGFVQALAAGADAIESGSVEHAYLVDEIPRAVERALREGRLSESRLADAAARTASLALPVDPGVTVDRRSWTAPHAAASRSAGPSRTSYVRWCWSPGPRAGWRRVSCRGALADSCPASRPSPWPAPMSRSPTSRAARSCSSSVTRSGTRGSADCSRSLRPGQDQ